MWFFCVGDRRNKALVTRGRLVVIITNMRSANSITWCVCVCGFFVCLFCFVCFLLYCFLFIGFSLSFLFSSLWLERKKNFFEILTFSGSWLESCILIQLCTLHNHWGVNNYYQPSNKPRHLNKQEENTKVSNYFHLQVKDSLLI